MPTIESPRILIKDKVEGAQGLRMLLEGLILFAREQTDEEMRIVTFSNQVSPFGPIAKDEAQTILTSGLTWSVIETPRAHSSSSSSKQPARLQKILNMLSGYTGATNPSRFYPEYERLFFNDSQVSQKHSALVKHPGGTTTRVSREGTWIALDRRPLPIDGRHLIGGQRRYRQDLCVDVTTDKGYRSPRPSAGAMPAHDLHPSLNPRIKGARSGALDSEIALASRPV